MDGLAFWESNATDLSDSGRVSDGGWVSNSGGTEHVFDPCVSKSDLPRWSLSKRNLRTGDVPAGRGTFCRLSEYFFWSTDVWRSTDVWCAADLRCAA